MKQFLFYFCIILSCSIYKIQAQTIVLSIDTIHKYAISEDSLIKLYPQAINNNKKLSILKSTKEQQAFQVAYNSLLREFNIYLIASNFLWTKKTAAFNRIYINKSGKIDFFTFSFQKQSDDNAFLNIDKYNQFATYLEEFLLTYRLPIKPKGNFSYSSPYIYQEVLINKNKTEE